MKARPKNRPPAIAMKKAPPWERIEILYHPENWPAPFAAWVSGIPSSFRIKGRPHGHGRTAEIALALALSEVSHWLKLRRRDAT
jgi:hypothetical protein